MREGYGFRACAHDLVGVAAPVMHVGSLQAPEGYGGLLHRASGRSLAGVDAPGAQAPSRTDWRLRRRGNRRPGLYTPDWSEFSGGYAWNQNFNNGNQNNNDKDWSARVRAVRK